ncbi:MAG: formate/nitrite transporter family protein [Bacteroidales bacterium]|nr:formate/nitrite transporter family protein [Bacteroidales bacterium]
MKQVFSIFRLGILAGIAIGIAGFGYLALKGSPLGDIAGAVVFSFGLATVVNYQLKLYTGAMGFVKTGKEIAQLLPTILGNIVGCLLIALLAKISPMGLEAKAQAILEGRLNDSLINGVLLSGTLRSGLLAIGCGFIMTTAVNFARQGKWIPLLFGVPMFIVCGFPHCIADTFYYLSVPWDFLGAHLGAVLLLFCCLVLGNTIGGNLYRLFTWTK